MENQFKQPETLNIKDIVKLILALSVGTYLAVTIYCALDNIFLNEGLINMF